MTDKNDSMESATPGNKASRGSDFSEELVTQLLPDLIQQVGASGANGRFRVTVAAALDAVLGAAKELLEGADKQRATALAWLASLAPRRATDAEFATNMVDALLPSLIESVYESNADPHFRSALAAGLEAVRNAATEMLGESQEKKDTAYRWLSSIGRQEMRFFSVLRVPAQADHRFRSKPITDSGGSRSPIPEQADHPARVTGSPGEGRRRVPRAR